MGQWKQLTIWDGGSGSLSFERKWSHKPIVVKMEVCVCGVLLFLEAGIPNPSNRFPTPAFLQY